MNKKFLVHPEKTRKACADWAVAADELVSVLNDGNPESLNPEYGFRLAKAKLKITKAQYDVAASLVGGDFKNGPVAAYLAEIGHDEIAVAEQGGPEAQKEFGLRVILNLSQEIPPLQDLAATFALNRQVFSLVGWNDCNELIDNRPEQLNDALIRFRDKVMPYSVR